MKPSEIREHIRRTHATEANTPPQFIKFWHELNDTQRDQVDAMYLAGSKFGDAATYCTGTDGSILSRRVMQLKEWCPHD